MTCGNNEQDHLMICGNNEQDHLMTCGNNEQGNLMICLNNVQAISCLVVFSNKNVYILQCLGRILTQTHGHLMIIRNIV